MVQLFFL